MIGGIRFNKRARGRGLTFDRLHVRKMSNTPRGGDFSRRAVNTANMLLEAAGMLENHGGGPSARNAQDHSNAGMSSRASETTRAVSRQVAGTAAAGTAAATSPVVELSGGNLNRSLVLVGVLVGRLRNQNCVRGRTPGFVWGASQMTWSLTLPKEH